MQEGAEFAVTGKFYAGRIDDFFSENFHGVGGVETAVFALSAVKDDCDVFDGAGIVFTFACDVEAVFAYGNGDFAEWDECEVNA
jgi:hypothetical protein